jgi:hypothetical protein
VYEARKEAREVALKQESEVDAMLHDIVKEVEAQAAQARPGAPVRRMYLLKRAKPEEREGAEGEVRVVASRKMAEKEEFRVMMGDVYQQLKTTEKEEGIRETLEVKKPPAEAAERKPSEVSFEELMGIKPAPAAGAAAPSGAAAAKPLFAELEALTKPEAAPVPPLAKPANAEFVSVQAEPGMGCPTCRSKGLRVVFCPYCGKGACANCSPKVTPTPESIVYVCPSCGEEVTVRKKTT